MASRPHALVIFAAFLLAGAAASAYADDPPRPLLFSCGRYYASWAGRPWSYDQQCWDHLVNIGATMNGCGLCWCDLEPTQGEYDWDQIAYADFQVNEMVARGIEPGFFVGLTPQWAALRPDLPPHRTPPSEAYVTEFQDYCRFIAGRYKGKVKYYFFWNEPNGCSWINDGCSNGDSYPLYTQWLIRCSQAMKQVDPNAQIIAGNLDYHSGVSHGYEYVQGMYDHGAGPHIDGIAIHPYDHGGTIHWRAVHDTRSVMVANGDADKGLWLNEYGWTGISEEDKSNRLVQVLTQLKQPEYSYVVMACYLVLNDGSGVEGYGLMDKNLNPRLSYYAFRDFDKTWPDHVDFSADVTTGPIPLTVQFTDESTVAGASAWLWEFGDGATSTVQHPAHEYTEDGVYTVRLTVTGTGGPYTAEKVDYIRAGTFPPTPGVANPSFEANDGSYDGWEIVAIGQGPDNPPLDNSNPWGPTTPFGTHFGGKITNGMTIDFYLGQVIGTTDWDPTATDADWDLSAWVQLNSTQSGSPNPTGVHQVWEIGWNDDGSEPVDVMSCDNYQTVASIDGNYTGNDSVDFYELTGSGRISGVAGLRGVAVRAHLYNDGTYWWTLDNIDNLSFVVTSVLPPEPPVSTPPGFYQAGWNLTSVPVAPDDPDPSVVFQDLAALGNVIEYNLYRYDSSVGYALYPLAFSEASRGVGYWLWLTTVGEDTVVSVTGTAATSDVILSVPEGWSLIGHPFPQPVALVSCQVTDGVTTVSFDEAVAAGWIAGALYYWEPGAGYRLLNSAGYGDDSALRPWLGYWVRANLPGLELIVPPPT